MRVFKQMRHYIPGAQFHDTNADQTLSPLERVWLCQTKEVVVQLMNQGRGVT